MLKTVYLPAFYTIICCVLPLILPAQPLNAVIETADRFWTEGRFAEAGEQYERAGRLKTDRPGLLYKAAEAYYRARDYRKAAECYRQVRQGGQKFDLAGLRYARALKQDGRYPEAREAFRQCFQDYRGEHKVLLQKVIENDIAGCDLALQLAEAIARRPSPVEIRRLPEPVNTGDNEWAPLPFSDDVLYFSLAGLPEGKAGGGPAKLLRTERTGGVWQAPVAARGLPEAAAEGFSSGVFSPDGKRFYCARCTERRASALGDDPAAVRARCEIAVLRRNNAGWTQPEPLRGYVNLPEFTNLAPAVAHDRGHEYLFFASDRSGGSGGLDLYVCERPLGADDLDFSLPRNLGPSVNSGGEETTPFFDTVTQTLYFSSNGKMSLGGFDVFKSVRNGNQWTPAENLGLPYNSPADELYFTLKKSGNGAFVSSNRVFGEEKTGTHDDDIFEFLPTESPLFLSGEVTDDATGALLTECLVSLFEQHTEEDPRLVQVQPSADGRFAFRLSPGGQYVVEATKMGYVGARVTLGAPNRTPEGYVVDLLLRRDTPAKPAAGDGRAENRHAAPAPHPGNGPYKIHLEVVSNFDPLAPRYERVRDWGGLISEPLAEPGLLRILAGDFPDAASAAEAARALRDSGAFPQAFVVKMK